MKNLFIVGLLLVTLSVTGQIDTTKTIEQNYYELTHDFKVLESKVYKYADKQHTARLMMLSGSIMSATGAIVYQMNDAEEAGGVLILSGAALSLAGYVIDWISVYQLRSYESIYR